MPPIKKKTTSRIKHLNVAPSSLPEKLKPYKFHGVDLSDWNKGDRQVTTECPFCTKKKFTIVAETGLWRCLYCNEGSENKDSARGGNIYTFLKLLWSYSKEYTEKEQELTNVEDLRKSRSLIASQCLLKWGVVKSIINDEWLIPGYSLNGTIGNLYAYRKVWDREAKKWGKEKVQSTPSIKAKIFGLDTFKNSKKNVYLCEGFWDGVSLYEALLISKKLADNNVLAIPGCNTFLEEWCSLFSGKNVYLCFDNDHPRNNPKTGKLIPSAGIEGMKTIYNVLKNSTTPPKQIYFLKWGEEGWNKEIPSGADVSDVLIRGILN